MINVHIRLVDSMDATPVSHADVSVIMKVVARWQSKKSGWPPVEVTVVDLDNADTLTKSGKSLVDGTVQYSFHVAETFQRQSQRTPAVTGWTLLDVIGVLSIQVARASVERTIRLSDEGNLETVHITDLLESELLRDNLDARDVVAVDFAKVIVGHTTPTSVTLWFCLHGAVRARDLCTCEIEQVTSTGSVLVKNQSVTSIPIEQIRLY